MRMGGIAGKIEMPCSFSMFKSLRVQRRFMFERKDVDKLIKYVESEVLKLGEEIGMVRFQSFKLEEWDKAVVAAKEDKGWGSQVLPCS